MNEGPTTEPNKFERLQVGATPVVNNIRAVVLFACILMTLPLGALPAAGPKPLTVAQVKAIIADARPGSRPNLSQANLSRLDLTGIVFRRANLNGADLLEAILLNADLSHAQMRGTNLSGVKMDHANLSNASLQRATFLTTANGVNFRGADLSGASGYLIAPDADFTRAIIHGAHLASDMSNQPMGLLHTIFARASLKDADLSLSDLSFADLNSANFRGANLRSVNFHGADLSAADFTGADLSGANVAQADVGGAIFAHIRGRSLLKGLGLARNRDQAIFLR